jgi:tRNA dimethylallyltransferase
VSKNTPKVIVILGPTASGKSALAVKLAKRFNGEIISADSRQVYQGLDIGTGKITKREMKGVPHHMIDVADPKRVYTVAQYQIMASKKIEEILKRGKLPIICGGTGFYIDALVGGLKIPEVKPNIELRKRLFKMTADELFEILKEKDPVRAKTIDRKNKVRLVRALEIAEALGTVPELKPKESKFEVLKIGIIKERLELKKLISNRLAIRLRAGMVKEVESLRKYGLSWKRLHDLGLEYRYVSEFLQKKITEKEMVEALNNKINQYAKRQMTWFRRDKSIHWIKKEKDAMKLVNEFYLFSHQPLSR